ncbi:DUF3791 domain-containing protein [Subdoligranulum sp. AM23-21AC]|uniref:DUF3791 domain-containing protein n=2 Tax=Ruthenibacterium lactatiformans TaxID=1550024 RepID=A0A0W7TN34_9FIRM|nr:hypothetical protein ASJ35_14720 [Ruthenibacterium lactatiformans]RGC96950.1 DUF3791 domain-containing protein [Subdoligranulum sp. AM16-9]RGD16568.1 DUF3791 domain-containing protein [Subdoligranulum sp. AM23-21AC]RJV96272.1 DUF3791 domain-containing protein [Subdoligranulum sp. AF14-43]MBD9256866.1 DUF3791 domain-containing protein [Ruthenibacterium lactatiformans]
MTRKEEILYMQTRLLRLAASHWSHSDDEIQSIFVKYGVYEYIEDGYELFHLEGDEAVLQEIAEMLKRKGVDLK